jgi:hypothetical protein
MNRHESSLLLSMHVQGLARSLSTHLFELNRDASFLSLSDEPNLSNAACFNWPRFCPAIAPCPNHSHVVDNRSILCPRYHSNTNGYCIVHNIRGQHGHHQPSVSPALSAQKANNSIDSVHLVRHALCRIKPRGHQPASTVITQQPHRAVQGGIVHG